MLFSDSYNPLYYCRDIPNHQFEGGRSPWHRLSGYTKKETSVVGEGTDLAACKSVTFKQCNVGSHVTVGQMTKLNNCVIMDNVTIGEK